MGNKNKKHFAENRLIFRNGEVPKLEESEIAAIKAKKEKEGPELDTASLVGQVNSTIDARRDQLKELPPEFTKKLHSEIVTYINNSPDRFDKDNNRVLSAKEFTAFRSAMNAKVQELVSQYAPTEAEIKKKREALSKAKSARESAEAVKALEAQDIGESPGEVKDLNTLGSKFGEYNGWNASLQKAVSDAMASAASFQKEYAEFQKKRNGLQAYKKFKSFFMGDDPEMKKLQDAKNKVKGKIDESISNANDAKQKLEKYGAELGTKSNEMKQEKITERDEKMKQKSTDLKNIDEAQRMAEVDKQKRRAKYYELNHQQNQLEEQQEQLSEYHDKVAKSHDKGRSDKEVAKRKQGELGKFDGILKTTIKKIDKGLKKPNLPDQQKKELKALKAKLLGKSKEVGVGLEAADDAIGEQKKRTLALDEEKKAIAEKSLTIDSHLNEQILPSMGLLSTQIMKLEEAKMKYATSREQVNTHYDKAAEHYEETFKKYDEVDAKVDDAILQNNLANTKLIGELENQKKAIGKLKIEAPSGISGFYDATLGVAVNSIGGGLDVLGGWIGEAGHFLLDQAQWLSNSLENARGEMGTFSYVLARIGTEIISTPIGVAGGLIEMAGGIVTMAGSPVQTIGGLGSLIGYNAATGEFSSDFAGTAWKEMGKALISYEDFSKGKIGVGIGKVFANVVTTVTGAGAATAGGKAAAIAYKGARAAGKGAARAIAIAAKAGGKAAGTFVKGAVVSGAKGAVGKFAKAGGAIRKGAGAAPGVLKAAPGAIGRGVMAAPGVIGRGVRAAPGVLRAAPGQALKTAKAGKKLLGKLAKSAGSEIGAQAERLWGGKRFKDVRLRKLVSKEAGLVDELGKTAEKYEEYQKALKKLKDENPKLTDKQLRAKLHDADRVLYTEGFAHQEKLKQLTGVQKKFDDAVLSTIKSNENKARMRKFLDRKNATQRGMVETTESFNEFKKLLDEGNPEALEAAQKFEEALASGDAAKIDLLKKKHPDWEKAFNHLEHRHKFGVASYEIAFLQQTEKIAAKVDVDPKVVESILKNNPELLTPELLKKSPKELKQIIESQHEVNKLSAKLADTPFDELDDFITKYNSSLEQGALASQEFQVLRNIREGVIIVDETGKLKRLRISKNSARDVLENLKKMDEKIQGRSYNLRKECLTRSEGTIFTHEAYTYGKPPAGKDLDAFLANPDNWVPERRALHQAIIDGEFEKAVRLSERLGDETPTIYALRGNTAAGKTTRLKNDPLFERAAHEGEVPGAINPDTYKGTLRAADATPNSVPTAWQAHEEGSMLAKRLTKKIETAKPPLSNLSYIVDKRLNKAENIQDLIESGDRLNRPIKILDVDSPFEASCQRVLNRAIASADPAVPFDAIADGFDGIRRNRRALIEQVRTNPNITDYVLYVTDELGDTVKVAEKKGGVFKVMPDEKAQRLFEEAMNPRASTTIQEVGDILITDDYIQNSPDWLRQSLERYKGKTLKEALNEHSRLVNEPPDLTYYLRESRGNLRKTSRAARGEIDVSASKDKAAKMAEQSSAEETARIVNDNYEAVIRRMYEQRGRTFSSPDELRAFVEQIGADVNKGITREGVLLRAGEDSTKYPYTKIADLEESMGQFYDELFQRLNNPHEDPVALAAWIEYRVNLTDHFFADGCGKSSQALSTFILMRDGVPMPRFRSKKEIVGLAAKTIRNPKIPQADHQQTLQKLLELYRERLNSME